MPTRLDVCSFPLFGGDGLLQHGLHARSFFKETRDQLSVVLGAVPSSGAGQRLRARHGCCFLEEDT
jgi:hypothetical protein